MSSDDQQFSKYYVVHVTTAIKIKNLNSLDIFSNQILNVIKKMIPLKNVIEEVFLYSFFETKMSV